MRPVKRLFRRVAVAVAPPERARPVHRIAARARRRPGGRARSRRRSSPNGREVMFDDYRLHVVSVIRDYGRFDRAEAPEDSREAHGG